MLVEPQRQGLSSPTPNLMRKIWLAVPEAKASAVTAVLVADGNTFD